MAFGNITSANSAAILTVKELFPAGIVLQQFATDQAITQDEVTFAETRMGVDAFMAAGFVPSIKPVNITFEPFSSALESIDQLVRATEQQRTCFECELVVRLPSIGKQYTWSGGVMKKGKSLPDLKKVLDPVSFTFDFEKLDISTL